MHAVIIYFWFVLIGLINDYRNVYSGNSDVCLGVCMTVWELLVCDGILCRLSLLKLIVSMKRDYAYICGRR